MKASIWKDLGKSALVKHVNHYVFKTPFNLLMASALAMVCVIGFVRLLEPACVFDLRRGVSKWKVYPYLCSLPWFASACDGLHAARSHDVSRVLAKMGRCFGLHFVCKVYQLLLAMTRPSVVRSTLILIGIPVGIFTLLCKSPSRVFRSTHAFKEIITLCITSCMFMVTSIRFPDVYYWMVNDVSTLLYISVLTLVLTISTIESQLEHQDTKHDIKNVCESDTSRATLYICSAVVAIWIVKLSNPRLMSFHKMIDPHNIVGKTKHI